MPSTQNGTPNPHLVSDTALLALAMSNIQNLRQQLSTAAIETNRLKAEVNTLKAKGRDQEMELLANKSRIEELQQREMLLPELKAQFAALDASDVTDRLDSNAVAADERNVDLLARAVEAEHELETAENERNESEKLVKRLLTNKDRLHKDYSKIIQDIHEQYKREQHKVTQPSKQLMIRSASPFSAQKRAFDVINQPESPAVRTKKYKPKKVICVECYRSRIGKNCDNGTPCKCCEKAEISCHRMKCENFVAGTCTKINCQLAHSDDGYPEKSLVPTSHVSQG